MFRLNPGTANFARTLLLAATASATSFVGEPASASQAGDSARRDSAQTSEAYRWSSREVRHLLNRAAFGANSSEIAHWVERGREALLDSLLFMPEPTDVYYVERTDPKDRQRLKGLNGEARKQEISRLRELDRKQGRDFLAWWVEEMAYGESPLRERMTLFWHGFFTSGLSTVKRAYSMMDQNLLLREHATGNYADLLRMILRDPAMLRYLDNDSNTRRRPNENLAREVMELFSLGEGNYTEDDVQEAARALTGRGLIGGRYHFAPRQHDFGSKTILGRTGRLDADDLVDVLLAQEACSRWVAYRLISYFEGVDPTEARLETYAQDLRDDGYELRPFLRKLFSDPAFYRDEVVGARISSPIDFLVGSCIRLRMVLPSRFTVQAASIAGMRLFEPPNVKGWEGGSAWIDSGSLMTRGNLVGLLVGTLDASDLSEERRMAPPIHADDAYPIDQDDDPPMSAESEEGGAMIEAEAPAKRSARKRRSKGPLQKLAGTMGSFNYRPRVHLTRQLLRAGVEGDSEIVKWMLEALLAIEPPAETYAHVTGYLMGEREEAGIEEGELLFGGAQTEPVLRRLAHLILSLPEAQLH